MNKTNKLMLVGLGVVGVMLGAAILLAAGDYLMRDSADNLIQVHEESNGEVYAVSSYRLEPNNKAADHVDTDHGYSRDASISITALATPTASES